MSEADPSDVLKKYREQFVASLPPDAGKAYRFVEPVAFGVTPQDATEIAQLVLDGVKTATGSPLWSYEADGKELPLTGDLWIVIDGNSWPVCIANRRQTSRYSRSTKIGEDYARWGGEGDCSLQSWRRMYWKYIEMECKRIGRDPSVKAQLAMERFGVVYPSRE